jgi:NADH-ubiquinone oxidoreductase chain 6
MMLFVLVLVVIFGLRLMFIRLNPIRLGVIVWAVALMSALIMGLLVYSWFGYIIFLVYVGGLLVIFGYFAAISPNIKGGFWSGVVWYLLWREVVGLVVM